MPSTKLGGGAVLDLSGDVCLPRQCEQVPLHPVEGTSRLNLECIWGLGLVTRAWVIRNQLCGWRFPTPKSTFLLHFSTVPPKTLWSWEAVLGVV